MQHDLIYDLGMHNGQDTEYYLKKGFRVVSVEANPDLVANANSRFSKYIESQQLTILPVAIAEQSGSFEFYINHQNSKWSSLFEQWGNKGRHGSHKISVDGMTLNEIMSEYGTPYYMKIDIEGADAIALSQISVDDKPSFVSIEGGGPPMLKQLSILGYDKYAVVNQELVPEIECPPVALEGIATQHNFEMGASGLFGREIQEDWLTYDEVVEERTKFRELIKSIDAKYPNSPNKVMAERAARKLGWYDVHATTDEALNKTDFDTDSIAVAI